MSNFTLAEYIWLDGAVPTRYLRSKARVINPEQVKAAEHKSGKDSSEQGGLSAFPQWSFDGSSTNQASGDDSDCLLQPVHYIEDPIRGAGNYLVMCEVLKPDGSPHESNSRAQLREILDAGAAEQDFWFGFEQEYTLFQSQKPLGWPENGFPGPQGPYYCGVGADEVFGRAVAEAHAELCLQTDLMYYGMNAEVMPGQWEFQVGFRGQDDEPASALKVCDHLWLARWLLYRVGEEFDIAVSIDNKPIKGDWNGAGMHTNISSKDTRDKSKGRQAIDAATKKLEKMHAEHIAVYGAGLADRLTGLHETCDISTFKVGTADRGCSIRIPAPVAEKGYGYFEDRRPGANADPYLVAARTALTLSGLSEDLMTFKKWPRHDAKIALAA